MKTTFLARAATLAALVAATGAAAAWAEPAAPAATPEIQSAPASFACPMHPQVHSLKPGVCPLCRMQLRPAVTPSVMPAGSDDQHEAMPMDHESMAMPDHAGTAMDHGGMGAMTGCRGGCIRMMEMGGMAPSAAPAAPTAASDGYGKGSRGGGGGGRRGGGCGC